jgi:hypothetical protein
MDQAGRNLERDSSSLAQSSVDVGWQLVQRQST